MQAFALKESSAESFSGGSLARRDGSTLNVGELLAAKDQTVSDGDEVLAVKEGYIVAVDDHDVALLSAYEALKQVPTKEATRVARKSPAAGEKED
jgi:hypothetical protein